jgi:hypothetical protein
MLITLNETKDYLGIPLVDTTYDAFLTLQLGIVSEAIEEYCNRKFNQTSYVQTFYLQDVSYTNQLPLFHFPLIGTPTVEEVDLLGNITAVTDFRYHSPTATLTKNFGRFFNFGQQLNVTYTAGYATIPAPVLGVLYGILQERYNKKANGIDINFGSDVQRISIPGTISIDFDYSLAGNDRKSPLGNILGNHMNVLDAYRSERSVVGTVRKDYVV